MISSSAKVRFPQPQWLSIALLAAVCAPAARADDILLHNGTSIAGVKVQDLKRSDIQFRYAGRIRSQPLADIRIIRLDTLPDLQRAEELLQKEQFAQAVSAFDAAYRAATTEWQKQWLEFRLISALDLAGRFSEAVEKYLAVIRQFPLEAERLRPRKPSALSSDEVSRLQDQIRKARADAASQVLRDALEALELSVDENAPPSPAAPPIPAREPRAGQAPASAPTPVVDSPASDQPTSPQGVAPLLVKARIALRNNRPDEAAALLEQALQRATPESLTEVYFLKGRYLFDHAADNKDLLRAGWWFTRVVANFPKNELAGECLYYLALIQQRIEPKENALALLRESKDSQSLSPETRRKVEEALDQLEKSK